MLETMFAAGNYLEYLYLSDHSGNTIHSISGQLNVILKMIKNYLVNFKIKQYKMI